MSNLSSQGNLRVETLSKWVYMYMNMRKKGETIMKNLEFAIGMEKDGEKYYLKLSEINKDNSLYTVCISLAKDETEHGRILRSKLTGISYELKDTETLTKAKSIFRGNPDFKNKIKENSSQLDLYRVALDKEKQSIDLYSGFLSEAADNHEKDLFEYLVKQEKVHYELIDELVMLLLHADEWVEDADFGLRQEFWRKY
jgi:rubrerythrin